MSLQLKEHAKAITRWNGKLGKDSNIAFRRHNGKWFQPTLLSHDGFYYTPTNYGWEHKILEPIVSPLSTEDVFPLIGKEFKINVFDSQKKQWRVDQSTVVGVFGVSLVFRTSDGEYDNMSLQYFADSETYLIDGTPLHKKTFEVPPQLDC